MMLQLLASHLHRQRRRMLFVARRRGNLSVKYLMCRCTATWHVIAFKEWAAVEGELIRRLDANLNICQSTVNAVQLTRSKFKVWLLLQLRCRCCGRCWHLKIIAHVHSKIIHFIMERWHSNRCWIGFIIAQDVLKGANTFLGWKGRRWVDCRCSRGLWRWTQIQMICTWQSREGEENVMEDDVAVLKIEIIIEYRQMAINSSEREKQRAFTFIRVGFW